MTKPCQEIHHVTTHDATSQWAQGVFADRLFVGCIPLLTSPPHTERCNDLQSGQGPQVYVQHTRSTGIQAAYTAALMLLAAEHCVLRPAGGAEDEVDGKSGSYRRERWQG